MTAVNGARPKRTRRAKGADGEGLGDRDETARHDGSRTIVGVEEQIAQKEPEQEEQQQADGIRDSDEDEGDGSEEDEEGEDEDEDEDDEEDEEDEDEEEAVEEDDEGSPLRFLENIDPNWFKGRSEALTPHPAPVSNTRGIDSRSPAASADDTEFYGAMIQMLTHVLGSSDSVTWPNQPTPGSQLAPSPFPHSYSSPAYTPSNATATLSAPSRSAAGASRSNSTNKGAGSKAELTKLQPMIEELIARLRKDQQRSTRQPVGEQDLTALLQTLMQQQQRQQDQQARQQGSQNQSLHTYSHPDYLLSQHGMTAPMSLGRSPRNVNSASASFDPSHSNTFQPMQFADLEFEEEDEDDPDFNPDLNPDLPFPSAWSLAVQDVVASEESRAAAAAAAVAASHSGTPSGTQTPADVLRTDAYRAGNVPLAGSIDHLAPRPSPAATGGRRTSFEQDSAPSSRRPSHVQPSPSVQVASAPPGRPGENEDRWSPSRDASTPAPSIADARSGSHNGAADHLMSPSGRPIRTSRKRPASSTPASPPRPTRMEAPAPSTPPPEQEAEAEAEAEQNAPKKRGRKAVLEPGEAARRRAQRNIEYQRARRQAKKAEESEQTETVVELKAEVRVLRAEIERLRDENATLRAQRELDRLRRSNGN